MFTITKKLALLYKKVKFSTSPNPSRPQQASSSAANFLQINNIWYHLRSCSSFFLYVQFFRYWKSKKISGYCMHIFIQESRPAVFEHFSVSLAACVINFHLEHSFYIDINKNFISYFKTLKMLFLILLPISYRKVKYPSFLIHFGNAQRIWWLGRGLGRCDRQSVVAKSVNLSWLQRSFCNRMVIV